MSAAKEFTAKAEQCRTLAATAADQRTRTVLLQMAGEYAAKAEFEKARHQMPKPED